MFVFITCLRIYVLAHLNKMAAEAAGLVRKRKLISAIVRCFFKRSLSLCSQEGKLSDDISHE